jgi:DAK2 domain fusion protein YloV
MQTLERLAAGDLVAVVTTYRDALRQHREALNRLNVYPVPDGDTGTNMSLTLQSVVGEIEQLGADPGLDAVAGAISHGSLMGARGNSGVILSQILRGLAEEFRGSAGPGIDGPVVAAALGRARDGAYKAVQNPVEGTILTVVRAAAEGAEAVEDLPSASLVQVLEPARQRAAEALANTPQLLPALAKAGVVDAGGAGLLLLLDSLLNVVEARPIEAPPGGGASPGAVVAPDDPPGDGDGRRAVRAPGERPEVSELRYEVMFLLEAADEAMPQFRHVWAGLGDSIVIVGGDGLYNCHIHTDDIGASIEAAILIGRPRRLRVTDLMEQVEEERWVREGAASAPAAPPPDTVGCAVVAVCAGEGVRRIFHSLGVQTTVAGGQSANPSTAEILAAIEAAPADEVVVLPNNKNVVAVAEAAAASSTKTVRVVPTKGIPEGFAALLEYDPEASAEDNARTMAANAGRVVAGEVTQAVRDADSDAGAIRAGDWLGLSREGIEIVADSAVDAAVGLLDLLVTEDHEIVTVIEGEGVHASDTRTIAEWLDQHRPGVAPEIHHGGQPLYPYLFSIE